MATPKLEPGAEGFIHADDAASTLRLHLAGMGVSLDLPGATAAAGTVYARGLSVCGSGMWP